MAWTHIRHRVEDYPKWKEVFDSTAEYKRSHGWKGYRIHAISTIFRPSIISKVKRTMPLSLPLCSM